MEVASEIGIEPLVAESLIELGEEGGACEGLSFVFADVPRAELDPDATANEVVV